VFASASLIGSMQQISVISTIFSHFLKKYLRPPLRKVDVIFLRSKLTEDNPMSVSSIGSTVGNFSTKALQSKSEASEAQKLGQDNDGDADDGGAASVKSTSTPTVNLNGQSIGQNINIKA